MYTYSNTLGTFIRIWPLAFAIGVSDVRVPSDQLRLRERVYGASRAAWWRYRGCFPNLKMINFWDIAPYTLTEVDRRFRYAYCIYHQGALSQKAVIFTLAAVRTLNLTIPNLTAVLTGNFHYEIPQLRIPHPVTSAQRNSCRYSYEVPVSCPILTQIRKSRPIHFSLKYPISDLWE
jgi:hypothetical protein